VTQAATTTPDAVLDPAAAASPSLADRARDYAELAKLRITLMVVITAFVGFVVGGGGAVVGPWWLVLLALAGTALCCMGASAFNQVYEAGTDAMMHRTRDRPVPAGRIGVTEGMLGGLGLSAAGLGMLLAVGLLPAGLAAFTIFSYAAVYTPMKRLSPWALPVGAVPGAMPPVIGYAAAAGEVGPAAGVLFAIMFLWQVPHFLAIAWLYREDYARAAMPMLPVLEPSGRWTFRWSLITCVVLLAAGALPVALGVSGWWYFAVSTAVGLGFLALAVRLVLRPTAGRARAMFLASLAYLPAVLAMLLVDGP